MLGLPSLLVGTGPLPPKALASLPPSASLPTGTQYEITDYGKNVAIVINGVWRFVAPFRTTWANRPAAALVSAGTELQATDYNNQKWISDGTVWRPAQGRVLLGQGCANGSTSIAIISGVTSGEWAITKPVLKGGMGIPGAKISVEALIIKTGTAGTYLPVAYVGTTSSMATDPPIGSVGVTLSSDAVCARIDLTACFGTNKNTFLRSGALAPQGQSSSSIVTQSANINTDSDMPITFGIASGFAADAYHLKHFAVWLEG